MSYQVSQRNSSTKSLGREEVFRHLKEHMDTLPVSAFIALIIIFVYIPPIIFAVLAFKRGRKGWGIALLIATPFGFVGTILGIIFLLLPLFNRIGRYVSEKNLEKPVSSFLQIIAAVGIFTIILVSYMGYKGGIVNANGYIDQKAFSVYAKVCEVEMTSTYDHPDSPNFIKQASAFNLFSTTSPKVLVIDSDGSAYRSNKGLGGDWNPQRLYDVQLVVCIDKENSAPYNTSCNGNSYEKSGRHLRVYQAKTGKYFMSSLIHADDDECKPYDSASLESIQQSLEMDIKAQQSMYISVP